MPSKRKGSAMIRVLDPEALTVSEQKVVVDAIGTPLLIPMYSRVFILGRLVAFLTWGTFAHTQRSTLRNGKIPRYPALVWAKSPIPRQRVEG